jgi:hypothetical protein
MSFLYSALWGWNRKRDESTTHILDTNDISVIKVDKEGNVQAKIIPSNINLKKPGTTSYYDQEHIQENNEGIAVSLRPKRERYIPTYSKEHISCQGNFTKLTPEGYVFNVTLLSNDIINIFSTKIVDYNVKQCIVKIKDDEILSEYDKSKGIIKLTDGDKYKYPLTINGLLSL